MLVEKSIGENQTRQKRAHRTPQGFPIKRCKICGAEFSPVCAIQRTCSKVCSREYPCASFKLMTVSESSVKRVKGMGSKNTSRKSESVRRAARSSEEIRHD